MPSGSPDSAAAIAGRAWSKRLRELGAEFGADYVITTAYPPLNLPRVGPDQSQRGDLSANRFSPDN